MNIYDTYYMLAAVSEMPPEHTFFKDRYFPTNEALDVFGTAKVLADYKDATQKKAPFVLPRIGSVSIAREGFSTYELEPGNICISIPLTVDQLQNRGFGEALMSKLNPEDRARMLLMNDLSELSSRISRTEELLAAQTMLNNGCTMRHQTETPDIYEDIPVQFYDGKNNPALYTTKEKWKHSTMASGEWVIGNWYWDICNMIKMLTSRGLPARDLVVSSDVGQFLQEDPWIIAALDNRRMEMGRIAPEVLTDYVTDLGVINFNGRKLDILVSDGTYEDDDGKDKPYLDAGSAIVTAPACGKGLYGGVTQLETDGQYHTYAGTRVPLHVFTMKPPVKETQLTSKPLLVPSRPSPWTVAKQVLDAE